jgi:hypothetical protein
VFCVFASFGACAWAAVGLFALKELEIAFTATSGGEFWQNTAFNGLTTAIFLIPGAAVWRGERAALIEGIRLSGWQKALVRGITGGPGVVCGFAAGCANPYWPSG